MYCGGSYEWNEDFEVLWLYVCVCRVVACIEICDVFVYCEQLASTIAVEEATA
jgi:hypothetical protein